MNTLEDRLRAALRTRAENFTAHPDAWQQTLERTRRPRGHRAMGRFAIPVAASITERMHAGTKVRLDTVPSGPPATQKGRWRRSHVLALTAGAVAIAVGAAIVLPIALPAGRSASFVTAAYAVQRKPDGTVAVTIKQAHDPAGLQRALRAEGIAAYIRYVPDLVKVQGKNITSGASCGYQPPVPAAPWKFSKVFSFPPTKDMGPSQKIDFLIHPAAIPKNDAVFVQVDWFPPSTWQRLQRSGELKAWPPQWRRDPAKIVGSESFGTSFTLVNKNGGLGPCVPNFNGPGYY